MAVLMPIPRYSVLICLIVMAASAGSIRVSMACPYPFVSNQGRCINVKETGRGWFNAEAFCRYKSSTLATIDHVSRDAHRKLLKAYGIRTAWVGLINKGTGWVWSSGEPFTFSDLAPPTPTSFPRCAALRFDSNNKFYFTSESCDVALPFLCSIGKDYCAWSYSPKMEFTGYFDDDGTSVSIVRPGILRRGEKDIGIGTWIAPDVFMVPNPAGLQCNWLAKISKQHVISGCQLNGKYTIANERIGAWNKHTPNCDANGVDIMATPVPSRPNGPTGKTTNPPAVTSVPQEQDVVVVAEEGPDVPQWLWPAAFGAVLAASVVAAVGVATRGGRSKKQWMQDNDDTTAPLTCDTCIKFDDDMARNRLKSIHAALSKELAKPLLINDVSCVSKGDKHLHVFDLQHELDTHTLGALSTIYARMKPPLPKNTRLHVTLNEMPAPAPQEAEEDDAMYYDGPTYY
eukprot:TRINITY_DN3871_c0_g1_i1.p1 TRINITY_DN3871_c0_g1~~TRINITY_DN3871_c0_g1_i1.p1  ORF type:complete len:457 (+),score=106.70 TRINITY_DN3871_c0_g1_i1:75-1445(+)